MARPKPLPFHRVRVVQGGDGRPLTAPPCRPLSMPMARIREAARRDRPTPPPDTLQDPKVPLAAPGVCGPLDPDPLGATEDALVTRDEAAEAPSCESPQAPSEALAEPAADDGPLPALEDRVPRPPEGADATRVTAAPAPKGGALRAVTRVAREATIVRSLAELLLERCDDESLPDTGPWTLTLPLVSAGMGASTVDIWLSDERVALRFLCREPGLSRLLSRHRDALAETLHRELCWHPDVEIDVSDA